METHDTLHELFGTAAAGYFHQLSKCFRMKKLVDKHGHDVYLPGLTENGECDCDPKELEWVKNIDIPIYLFCGKFFMIFNHIILCSQLTII